MPYNFEEKILFKYAQTYLGNSSTQRRDLFDLKSTLHVN